MEPDLTNVTWMLRTQWSVTALFFLGSVPSTAAPPTRTRSTLTRVRLAVSGLGGCFCQQSFNERKWNTSPCPLPPSLAQLSVVAGLIGLQPPVSSHQVEMQLRLCFGNYVIIRADYCLAVAFVYKRDEQWTHRPDSRCTFLFNFFLQEKYLGPFTYVLN